MAKMTKKKLTAPKNIIVLFVLALSILVCLSGCGSSESKIDWHSYVGTWGESEISGITGGMYLDFAVLEGDEGESAEIYLCLVQAAPASRSSEVYCDFLLKEMRENSYSGEFEDSWGNSGELVLTFNEDTIECVIKDNMKHDSSAMWGMYPGTYTLFRNDDIYELLDYDIDEYYEMFPDEAPEGYGKPTHDTSKASGILASLGMTEEQFRASCKPLSINGHDKEITTAKELREYPGNYMGQHFYISGDFLGTPDTTYSPHWVTVNSKGMSADGYPTYIDYPNFDFYEPILIFDMRDDIYAPTISEDDGIYPYLIFNGVQTINGTDYVCFLLISADKT